MGNRGVQAAVMAVVVLLAVVTAVAVNGNRKSNRTATGSPSPTATSTSAASPLPTTSPVASPSPSASAVVVPSPVPSPSTAPAPAPTTSTAPTGSGTGTGTGTASGCSTAGSGGSGPAAYPAQIQAGRTYSYCGPRALVSHATDTGENASGVCAGINSSTQSFPSGYEGVFFVGVQFPDGRIVSSGYTRSSTGANREFGSVQTGGADSQPRGVAGGDPGDGSHTYCVNRSGSQWVMTRDGSTIYSTAEEPATSLVGATLKFDSDVETAGAPAAQSFSFVVPGFHDILVGGQGPRQLRGAAFYA